MRVLFGLIIIGVLMAASSAFSMDLYVSKDEGFNYIMAGGKLSTTDANRLRILLRQHRREGLATAILLSSPGGILEVTNAIARAIVEESNLFLGQHQRANLLVINDECSSACTSLTAAITKLRNPRSLQFWVSPGALFGFHSPVEPDASGHSSQIQDPQVREAKIEKQIRQYLDHGVDASWLQKNIGMLKRMDLTAFSGKELCAQRSLVIPPLSCLENDNDVVPLIERVLTYRARRTP